MEQEMSSFIMKKDLTSDTCYRIVFKKLKLKLIIYLLKYSFYN